MDIGALLHGFLFEESGMYVSYVAYLPPKLLNLNNFAVVVSPFPQLFGCILKDSASDILSVDYILLTGYDACKPAAFLGFLFFPYLEDTPYLLCSVGWGVTRAVSDWFKRSPLVRCAQENQFLTLSLLSLQKDHPQLSASL